MVAMANRDQNGWRKGPWTPEEDKLLSEHVKMYGEGRWSSVSRCSGLSRSGKSCRLRWVNYLRPGLKRGHLTPQEQGIIIELHALWGNRWSTIARYLPGRTDNEIKNYWRTHFKKKEKSRNKQSKTKKARTIKKEQQQEQEIKAPVETQELKHPTMEDQCLPVNQQQDHNNSSNQANFQSWENSVAEMDSYGHLWSGLWNLDDDYLDNNNISYAICDRLISMQNQVTNEFNNFGGDLNSVIYGGGYMF